MRKSFGAKPLTYPQPVFILAAFDSKGIPNAMNAAWGGISEENQISICLSANHKTVYDILETKVFSVSMGTVEQVDACDYVGLVSGNKVPNKVEKAGWHVEKGQVVDCPIIVELPFALECKLIDYNPETCIMRGEIVNVSVDEAALTDGKIDPKKVNPICFDPCNMTYLSLGEAVAKAFSCGLKMR